jgi:hypothetical protein
MLFIKYLYALLSKMVQVVMLLICIQEVAGLNFGWGTDYPD